MSNIKPMARQADIVVQEFADETLIYDLTINKAFALNQTSSIVWQLCDGTKTVAEIANQLSIKLNDLVTEDLVWLTLDQLKKENLIENDSILSSPFEGFSRREVIRKIGFASMVALPVIASLVAPTAVNAASCGIALGQPSCTADFQCCSPATTCTTGPTRRCCVGAGDNLNGQSATSVNISGETCATLSLSVADTECDANGSSVCCSGNARYWAAHPTRCADVAPNPTVRIRCICSA